MFLIYDLVKIAYIARADWSYQASGGNRGAGSRGCTDGKMMLEGVSYGKQKSVLDSGIDYPVNIGGLYASGPEQPALPGA